MHMPLGCHYHTVNETGPAGNSPAQGDCKSKLALSYRLSPCVPVYRVDVCWTKVSVQTRPAAQTQAGLTLLLLGFIGKLMRQSFFSSFFLPLHRFLSTHPPTHTLIPSFPHTHTNTHNIQGCLTPADSVPLALCNLQGEHTNLKCEFLCWLLFSLQQQGTNVHNYNNATIERIIYYVKCKSPIASIFSFHHSVSTVQK